MNALANVSISALFMRYSDGQRLADLLNEQRPYNVSLRAQLEGCGNISVSDWNALKLAVQQSPTLTFDIYGGGTRSWLDLIDPATEHLDPCQNRMFVVSGRSSPSCVCVLTSGESCAVTVCGV